MPRNEHKRNCARRLTALLGLTAVLMAGCSTARQVPEPPAPDSEFLAIWHAVPDQTVAQPAEKRHILVFSHCEGFAHQSIEWTEVALEFMAAKTGAFEVTVSTDMSVFEASNLARFDAVLFNNTTQLKFDDPNHRRALLDFVRGGKGVIGIHAATDNFYDWPEAAEMMGGLFDGHPWHAGDTWAVKIDEPEHPLNAAFEGRAFLIKDEIYQIMGPYSRDTHRVLLSLDMSNMRNYQVEGIKREDGDFAVSWVKPFGAGRVFYGSFGHNKEVFENAAVLEHYFAGIQYALGDLDVDDAPSAALANTPVTALTTDIGAVEDPYEAIVSQGFGSSRLAQAAIEAQIRGTAAEYHVAIEDRLIGVLENSQSTYAAKQFVCRMLRRIGANRSLPHLEQMLLDDRLTDDARFALQSQDSPEADRILRESLGRLTGPALIGVIGTIGQRRDRQAVPMLVALADASDTVLSGAVISSLGHIGGAAAMEALTGLDVSAELEPQRLDALLMSVDGLVSDGGSAEAQDTYQRLTENSYPVPVRIAAWRGLVHGEGSEAMPSLVAMLRSEEPEIQLAGARYMIEMQDRVDLLPLAGELQSLPSNSRALAISALAEAGVVGAAPFVTSLVEAADGVVRTAAIRALGQLGDASHVPLLAAIAVNEDDSVAARHTLVQLWGEGVDERIIAAASEYQNEGRAALVDILALRYSDAAIPTFLSYAEDSHASVREASIGALTRIADDHHLPELITLLERSETAEDRVALEEAVVAVCERMPDRVSGVNLLLAALERGSEPNRVSLLRILGNWPDNLPLENMLGFAESVTSEVERAVAISGVVELMSREHERTSDEDHALFSSLLESSRNNAEMELVLDGLSGRDDVWIFDMVEPLRANPHLAEKAQTIRADLVEAVARTVSHDGAGAPVTLANPYASQYDGGGDNALTDDRWGSVNARDAAWQGFEGSDLDAVIDLGRMTEIRGIRAGFLQANGSWIFLPSEVTFSIAGEDRDFKTVATFSITVPEDWQPTETRSFSTALSEETARYIRVFAKNVGTLPDWHPGAGGLAWLFADEIQINAHLDRL